MSVSPFRASLGFHSNDDLAEVLSVEHSDERFGRFLETVNDVFAITDAAICDTCSDLAQEFGIMLFSEVVVDESAQRQALRQDLALGRRKPVGTVARSRSIVLSDQAADRH